MMGLVHDSATPETGPQSPRARRRLTVTAALFVVVAVGIFVWWGQPRLAEGGMVGTGAGMTWANDGVEDTRMLVRGKPAATVSARFSIRNEGNLPFTVHGLDVAEMTDWLSRQQVTFVPGYPGENENATPVKQVTLGPGDEASVFWSLDMACQPPLSEGNFMELDALRFKVSWLGIPATREMPLDRPIAFAGDNTSKTLPGAECDSD